MNNLPKDTTMNIYAEHGDKVQFKYPKGGYDSDITIAEKYLKPNAVYTVDFTTVGGFHTSVYLQEFSRVPFNSCLFCDVKKKGKISC